MAPDLVSVTSYGLPVQISMTSLGLPNLISMTRLGLPNLVSVTIGTRIFKKKLKIRHAYISVKYCRHAYNNRFSFPGVLTCHA